MQPIKFDLNAVGHLAERQRQLVKDVSQITSSVYSMTYRIDYRILARRNIRYRTSNVEMNLRQLEQRMMKLHELMLSAVRLYEDTEKKLERKAEEIAGNKQKSWLVRLFDAIGEFDLRKTLDAISRWLDSEDGRPVKEYLLSLEQVQDTSSDAQLPQLDTTNYKKLTGYYEWVTTGKSRTLYYTDAYGFRETIDINQVISLVQEYNFATGNNYFSGDIIMMMPIDFTDFFAYAIQRGYDPRTFKPIDTNDMEAILLYIAARKLGEEISRLKARTRESLALDLIPYLGTGKSIIELYQGKNLLTGEELDGWDYAFGAAGTVLPLLKAGRRLFKIFKGADNIEEAVDAGKITEDVGKKIGGRGNLDKILINVDIKKMTSDELSSIIRNSPEVGDELIEKISAEFGSAIKSNPLRQEYENAVQGLSELSKKLKADGLSDEAIARQLHEARRDLGMKYKDLSPQLLKEYIYDVNIGRYQDPLGPTIDYLVKVKGKTWADIIDSATRPNPDVNSLLGGFKNWLRAKNGL